MRLNDYWNSDTEDNTYRTTKVCSRSLASCPMTRNKYELAILVEGLLNKKLEAKRRNLWADSLLRGGRIRDVGKDEVGIDPSAFTIVSTSTSENGDTIIEWEATGFVKSSLPFRGPSTVKRSGTLLIRRNGEPELL